MNSTSVVDSLDRIWALARVHLERRGMVAWATGDLGSIKLADLDDRELFALSDVLSAGLTLDRPSSVARAARRGTVVEVHLADLDIGLQLMGEAQSLVEFLEVRSGMLRDRPAEKEGVSDWMSAIWASPRTASLMGESWFGAWIDSLHADALLSRVCPGSEKPVISTVLEMLGPSLDGAVEPVLDRLDRAGLALGFDAPIGATYVMFLRALATRFGVPRPDLQDESACDDLLSAAGLCAERAGVPVLMTKVPNTPATIFATTSPLVYFAARRRLGPLCSPLMLLDRWNAGETIQAIASCLDSGHTVRLRADFDEAGVNWLDSVFTAFGPGARADSLRLWRFTEADYEAAANRWAEVLSPADAIPPCGRHQAPCLAGLVARLAEVSLVVPEVLMVDRLLGDL